MVGAAELRHVVGGDGELGFQFLVLHFQPSKLLLDHFTLLVPQQQFLFPLFGCSQVPGHALKRFLHVAAAAHRHAATDNAYTPSVAAEQRGSRNHTLTHLRRTQSFLHLHVLLCFLGQFVRQFFALVATELQSLHDVCVFGGGAF